MQPLSQGGSSRHDAVGFSRARRALFGQPSDEEKHEVDEYIRDATRRADDADRSRGMVNWNFDFENESPIVSRSAKWHWERVPDKQPEPLDKGIEAETDNSESAKVPFATPFRPTTKLQLKSLGCAARTRASKSTKRRLVRAVGSKKSKTTTNAVAASAKITEYFPSTKRAHVTELPSRTLKHADLHGVDRSQDAYSDAQAGVNDVPRHGASA